MGNAMQRICFVSAVLANPTVIRHHYPTALKDDILQMLPDRNWACIRMEAIQLNVKREIARAGSLPKKLTWSDWEFMQQQGIGKLDRTPKFEALFRQTHEFQDLAHMLTRLRLLLATHSIA